MSIENYGISISFILKVIQELLGHCTTVMTMDMDSHLLPSIHQDATNKMNDLFKIKLVERECILMYFITYIAASTINLSGSV